MGDDYIMQHTQQLATLVEGQKNMEKRVDRIELLLEKYDQRMDLMDTGGVATTEQIQSLKKLVWWILGGGMTIVTGAALLALSLILTYLKDF